MKEYREDEASSIAWSHLFLSLSSFSLLFPLFFSPSDLSMSLFLYWGLPVQTCECFSSSVSVIRHQKQQTSRGKQISMILLPSFVYLFLGFLFCECLVLSGRKVSVQLFFFTSNFLFILFLSCLSHGFCCCYSSNEGMKARLLNKKKEDFKQRDERNKPLLLAPLLWFLEGFSRGEKSFFLDKIDDWRCCLYEMKLYRPSHDE